jgi:hypothetical protein
MPDNPRHLITLLNDASLSASASASPEGAGASGLPASQVRRKSEAEKRTALDYIDLNLKC